MHHYFMLLQNELKRTIYSPLFVVSALIMNGIFLLATFQELRVVSHQSVTALREVGQSNVLNSTETGLYYTYILLLAPLMTCLIAYGLYNSLQARKILPLLLVRVSFIKLYMTHFIVLCISLFCLFIVPFVIHLTILSFVLPKVGATHMNAVPFYAPMLDLQNGPIHLFDFLRVTHSLYYTLGKYALFLSWILCFGIAIYSLLVALPKYHFHFISAVMALLIMQHYFLSFYTFPTIGAWTWSEWLVTPESLSLSHWIWSLIALIAISLGANLKGWLTKWDK